MSSPEPLVAPKVLLEAIRGLLLDAEPRPHASASSPEWADFQQYVDSQRCWPLVVAAFERAPWPFGDDAWDEAVTRSSRALGGCLHLDREAIEVARILNDGSIPFALTKGVSFAQRLWKCESWRSFGDIDLIVGRSDIPAAVELLTAAGAHLHGNDPAHTGIGEYAKSVTYLSASGSELDMHMNLCEGPYSFRIPEKQLLGDPASLEIGGKVVPTLAVEQLFLHACIHALLPSDKRRLVPMTDVAMGTVCARIDPALAVSIADRWGVSAVMARAISEARRAFELPSSLPLVDWAEGYKMVVRDRRWLAAYHTTGLHGVVLITLCKVEAQNSWSDRRDYVRFLVRRPDGGIISRAREMRRQLTGR